jgi:hypothetical protein
VQNFANQKNIDMKKITLLQKKKFADVFYQKSFSGLVSASNQKKRLTMEYSGPNAVQIGIARGLFSMERSVSDSCMEFTFPEKYVGPAISPQGSWSF